MSFFLRNRKLAERTIGRRQGSYRYSWKYTPYESKERDERQLGDRAGDDARQGTQECKNQEAIKMI